MIKLFLKKGVDLFISDDAYGKLLKSKTILTDLKKYLENFDIVYYKKKHGNTDTFGCNFYENKKSTLVWAIEHQNTEIVKHLLQANSFHFNQCCLFGNYFLHQSYEKNLGYELILACKIGNKEIVELLLKKGANLFYNEYKEEDKNIPINIAFKYNHMDVVEILLKYTEQSNPETLEKFKKYYYRELIKSLQQGREWAIKLLIENGKLNVNYKDDNEKSILMYALESSFKEDDHQEKKKNIITYLIENGAMVKDQDKNKITVLMYTCLNCNENLFDYIMERVDTDTDTDTLTAEDVYGNNALFYACQDTKHDSKFYKLLEKFHKTTNVDINKQNKNGETILYTACSLNNLKIIKYLIKKYSDIKINIKAYNRKSILQCALEQGNINIATYLIGLPNIKIDLFLPNENSLLIQACQHNWEHIVKFLLKYLLKEKIINVKKIINAKDKNGKTPLIYACENGNINIVEELINNKATIDCTCNNGNSPLMYAVMNNNAALAKILLNHSRPYGHLVDMENKNGQTPLIMASHNGNLKIVKILKKAL